MSTSDSIKHWVEVITDEKLIDGCITGSCLLEADFDTWDIVPDIDIFCYNHSGFVHAIDVLTMKHGFKLGAVDNERSQKQEETKWKWALDERKMNKSKITGISLETIKLLSPDGCIVNVSRKQWCKNVAEVLASFDMTIIMQGIDIMGGYRMDMRGLWSDKDTAVFNPLRTKELSWNETAYYTRQFDRVMKYWDRGYDTRPVARFYVEQIDFIMENGSIWASDKAIEFYNSFMEEFTETKKKIEDWLKEVE